MALIVQQFLLLLGVLGRNRVTIVKWSEVFDVTTHGVLIFAS